LVRNAALSRHWFEISRPNFQRNELRTNSRFWTAIKLPSMYPNPAKCRETDSTHDETHLVDSLRFS
jgi:hypothetical protein